MTRQGAELAHGLRDALRPIWRRLMTDRTVSMSRLAVLSLLRRAPMTAADLARREHVSPQAMTGILQELEEEGHVARERDAADRRRIVVELTSTGRKAADAALDSGNDWLANAIDHHLTPADRTTLRAALAVLAKLNEAAERDAT